ncbi:hypothetical protein EV651_110189 [Kribbella sp. VKM Ac-2571]|uniref:hypothetical protein n=1 Tax=Kribbella sp. VKM Ac-2571 TaxID=2512222 RepID=UPI00105FC0A9|nr:hypothetical protein [Kribbella sp. VKM Ac-2571]TDO58155.1 hypothetical protein EV651_110189 [Kribbella sp. VKM Ac-2571]
MDASEKLIADTLSKHAADAPADDHLLSVVHARLRHRRTGRSIGAVVVAAAVVATAITTVHSLTAETRTDPQVSRPGPAAAGWRWESYKTVQVQVPSSWTQYISGPAPCTTFANSAVPSVGRLNGWLGKDWYTCSDAVLPLNSRQPYLWFDDNQAPGIKRYDAGWTEETRLVAGTKISVLTQDDTLRRRILDSARPITGTDYYGCAPTDLGPQGTGLNAKDPITSADVCEYWHGSLVSGSQLGAGTATAFAQRVNGSPEGPPSPRAKGCGNIDQRTFVVTLHGRAKSYSVRIIADYCSADHTFATDDGTTRRRADGGTLGLIQQGVHKPTQPSDIFDPVRPITPPNR